MLSTPAGTLTRSSRPSRLQLGHSSRGCSFRPRRPQTSTVTTASAPNKWLSAVPSAIPTNPREGSGPKPMHKPQAVGKLTTATPLIT